MDRVWPPSFAPIAHGLPTSPRFGVRALFRPLRFVLRSGGSAGGRRRRSRAPRAPAAPLDARRSRPTSAGKLVPGAEPREPAVDVDAERRVEPRLLVPVAVLRRRAPPRGSARRGRAAPAPSDELAGEVGLARLELARHLLLPRRDAVDPRRDGVHQRPGASTLNEPAPPVVAERLERRLRQRRAPGARKRTAAPSTSWPSRKIVAATSTRSPTTRLTGKRPQSTCGSTSWIWIRGGGSSLREWHGVRLSQVASKPHNAPLSGVLLHPTSLPGGRLGEEAYRFVDWLAAAGQSWWQVLPLGPPDDIGSPYASASAFAASPALLAEPDARGEPEEVEDFVARHPYWIGRLGGVRRRGALADQVRFEREWSALRDYARGARRPHDRRRADLRRRRQRRRTSRIRSCSRPARSRARRRTRCANRPALGQSALRLAGAPRDAATAGGSSASAARSSSST